MQDASAAGEPETPGLLLAPSPFQKQAWVRPAETHGVIDGPEMNEWMQHPRRGTAKRRARQQAGHVISLA